MQKYKRLQAQNTEYYKRKIKILQMQNTKKYKRKILNANYYNG